MTIKATTDVTTTSMINFLQSIPENRWGEFRKLFNSEMGRRISVVQESIIKHAEQQGLDKEKALTLFEEANTSNTFVEPQIPYPTVSKIVKACGYKLRKPVGYDGISVWEKGSFKRMPKRPKWITVHIQKMMDTKFKGQRFTKAVIQELANEFK